MRYAIVGEHLPHSHSPEIHKLLGNPDYTLCELEKDALVPFMRARDFDGVNVTIPYKQDVMPLCDFLDGEALRIGAVNTVANYKGSLFGFNTDFDGFLFLCRRAGIPLDKKHVVILGGGGTSKTARAAAEACGARKVTIVSRKGSVNYKNLQNTCADAEILINTTPVGMFPNITACPLDLAKLPALTGVIDVIYNPLRTRLVLEAEKRGIPCAGGLAMLVAQAAYADSYFRGQKHSENEIAAVLATMLQSLSNLVLIGMPGCGKSTVGKILAEKTGRPLYDLDLILEKRTGMSAGEIIRTRGEQYFRDLETEICLETSEKGGCIIACGGGTVLRAENRDALRQNGCIIYLQRALCKLATDGRPLSSSAEILKQMYVDRAPIYEALADITIPECSSANESAAKTLSAFKEKKGTGAKYETSGD